MNVRDLVPRRRTDESGFNRAWWVWLWIGVEVLAIFPIPWWWFW